MVYKLLYTKSAANDIKKLDSITKKRLKIKLETFSKNPFLYAKKLTDHALGMYRFRIGNYRVIFDIEKNIIIILRVRHRRDIYKQ